MAVPTPTTTASTRARSRCRCTSPAGPLMYFECPDFVAIRPSSDWPIWPTITRSSTVPLRSGPNTSAQARGRGWCPPRNILLKSSQGSEDADLLDGRLLVCTQKLKTRCGCVNNATVCHHPTKIILFATGMMQGARCSTITAIRMESLGMSDVQTGASSALFGGRGHTSVSRGLGEFQGGGLFSSPQRAKRSSRCRSKVSTAAPC